MKIRYIFTTIIALCAICLLINICEGSELQVYTNATLIDSPYNDGDSFRVKIGDSNITIRLYFADCPETKVSQSTDARRVRSQTRYFGMPNHRKTVAYGREATQFTKEQLEKPFTVYTAHASALGRSPGGRYYGFITTYNGKDLASLLVANGYARAYGVARKTPNGISHKEMAARLKDIESSAMLTRKGIWETTDINQLVAMRALERQEDAELKEIHGNIRVPLKPININTASKEELRLLPRIGPVISNRIILNRPYTNNKDLLRIDGITERTMKELRPHLANIDEKSKK